MPSKKTSTASAIWLAGCLPVAAWMLTLFSEGVPVYAIAGGLPSALVAIATHPFLQRIWLQRAFLALGLLAGYVVLPGFRDASSPALGLFFLSTSSAAMLLFLLSAMARVHRPGLPATVD